MQVVNDNDDKLNINSKYAVNTGKLHRNNMTERNYLSMSVNVIVQRYRPAM